MLHSNANITCVAGESDDRMGSYHLDTKVDNITQCQFINSLIG
jgi:hypothetical protein